MKGVMMARTYLWSILIGLSIIAGLWFRQVLVTRGAAVVVPAIAGDTVFIRTTHHQRILIDTANDAPTLLQTIGEQSRSVISQRVVDLIIITQPGEAGLGGLNALIAHGATQVAWLPASASLGVQWCAQVPQITCTFPAAGHTWHIDDVAMHVVDTHSVAVYWAQGGLLVSHGTPPDPATLPRPPSGTIGLIYPWRIAPDEALWRAWHPQFVIYSDGLRPRKSARLSMAQRRQHGERQFHEIIDGTLIIPMTSNAPMERIPKDDS